MISQIDFISNPTAIRHNFQNENTFYKRENFKVQKNINIITDLNGSKIVLINDVRFQSRRKIDWGQVEGYLKEFNENAGKV